MMTATAIAMMIVASLTGCKRGEGGSTAIAALLPANVAAQVPAELQLIAEQLPEGVQGFAFLDRAALHDVTQFASWVRYAPALKDFTAMTKRRWGFDLTKVRGAGLVSYQGEWVVALVVPSTKPQPAANDATNDAAADAANDLASASVGPVVILGERRAVEAFADAVKKKARLYKISPGWISSALPHAAGQRAFFTGDISLLRAELPDVFAPPLANIDRVTFAAGATGLGVFLASKPGRGPQVEGEVQALLGLLRARLAVLEQELEVKPGLNLAAVMLHHHGAAALKSLEQKRTGDELALTLGWHAPQWPKRSPTPLVERLSVVDEMAVSQLNLGMPFQQLFTQLTDVFSVPIDRAAFSRDLAAALVELGIPNGLDPSAFTVSAGASGYLISVKNAPLNDGGAPLALPFADHAAIQTKWGLAVAEEKDRDAMMLASVSENPPAAGLAQAKLLTDDTAFLRIFFDVTKVPPAARTVAVLASLRSVSIAFTETSLVIEAHTDPGKAKELASAMRGALATVASLPFLRDDKSYSERAKLPSALEGFAIVKHHQLAILNMLFSPQLLSGDRLRVEWRFEPVQGRAFFVALSTAMVSGAISAAVKRKLGASDADMTAESHAESE